MSRYCCLKFISDWYFACLPFILARNINNEDSAVHGSVILLFSCLSFFHSNTGDKLDPIYEKDTLTVILLTKLTLISSTFHVFRPIHRLVQMGILAFPEAPVYQVPTVATERRGRKESVETKEGRVRLVPKPLQIGSNAFGRKVMTETTDCYR